MAHDVFISYSHDDKPVADGVCHALEDAGIRVWIAPRDIIPGLTWASEIVKAIRGSRLMVVIFSSASNLSEQVQREVGHAVTNGLTILPFRIQEVPPTGDMEYYLSATHWLDAFPPPLERHTRYLVESVRVILRAIPDRGVIVGDEAQPAPPVATPMAESPTQSRVVDSRPVDSSAAESSAAQPSVVEPVVAKSPPPSAVPAPRPASKKKPDPIQGVGAILLGGSLLYGLIFLLISFLTKCRNAG